MEHLAKLALEREYPSGFVIVGFKPVGAETSHFNPQKLPIIDLLTAANVRMVQGEAMLQQQAANIHGAVAAASKPPLVLNGGHN